MTHKLQTRILAICVLLVFQLFLPISSASVDSAIIDSPDNNTLGYLKDFNGKERLLNEYTGKGEWVVVMLWASDCKVSNNTIHTYNDLHNASDVHNLQIIGISLDGTNGINQARRFIENHSVDFPNFIGNAQTIPTMYKLLTGQTEFATPAFLLFNPEGELLAHQVGAIPADMIESFIKQQSK